MRLRQLHAFAFRAADDWHGRFFLLDPSGDGTRRNRARAIRDVLEQLVPALAGICDLQALTHRAAASERARLGRELHDGVVHGLAGIGFELEVLRRSAACGSAIKRELDDVQGRLRAEVSNPPQLSERARGYQVDSRRIDDVLRDLVEQFRRETGMAARFASRVDSVKLSGQVCGELARIVQEALVNVRRHSGARQVVVKFTCREREWRLSIQDDGHGFPTWMPGRSAGDHRSVQPPAVISERVRGIGGVLRVATTPDGGARLDMTSAPSKRASWREPSAPSSCCYMSWSQFMRAVVADPHDIAAGIRRQLSNRLTDDDQSGAMVAVEESNHPAEAILDFAGDAQVDLILMGTHGRRAMERLLLGTVAERVRSAPCPVVTGRHSNAVRFASASSSR